MKLVLGSLTAAVAAVSFISTASAAALFSEAGENVSNYKVLIGNSVEPRSVDGSADVVDYSALSIPEAPNKLAGSAATKGIRLSTNNQDATAFTSGINLVLGSTPITFTGTHTLQFDVWMDIPANSASSTEAIMGGVSRQVATEGVHSYFRTALGNSQQGAWFTIKNDNDAATTVDFRFLDRGTQLAGFGDHTNPDLFNAAFNNDLGTTNASPSNEWVRVNVVQDNGTASVYFNGVLFATGASTDTSGFAWFGYEDLYNSISSEGVVAIFDNIYVVEGAFSTAVVVPEPTTLAAVAGLGGLAMIRRRRA